MNSLTCKTRILSSVFQGIDNTVMIFGWTLEFCLIMLVGYIRPLGFVLNTRDLLFLQTIWYGSLIAISILVYDEIRKYLIRNFPKQKNKPNYFMRNSLT